MPASDEYLESQVLTATPHQLHLMVVEGAIKYAAAAESALGRGDFGAADAAFDRATRCVADLVDGLNAAHTPEMVDSAKSLFLFIYRNLLIASVERDAKRVADALLILRLHRETWLALGDQIQRESALMADTKPDKPSPWTLLRSA